MGAKQSKRSVDISGKEAESAGEVAASIAGGEGRVEQLADADALKPQLNGDAHIHETEEKQKDIDSGTPENEKDATTEKEAKQQEEEKEAAPLTNGESEQKVENGESTPTPEDGKKPKKEKVKKKWSLRSISFSRKDKPKQEKKAKDEEPKTNGEPEKVPEETAEVAPEVPVVTETAEEAKTPSEAKEDKTPETPVTEPITNGSSTPESPKVETPVVEEPAAPEIERPEPKVEIEPEQLPVNGLSLEETPKEATENEKTEDSKEEPTAETTEIVPEISVKKEVCVEQMPLIDTTPPPLPANPPPSSVASFAATTMAPELTDASLANTADNATPPLPPSDSIAKEKLDEIPSEPENNLTVTQTVNNVLPCPVKEISNETSTAITELEVKHETKEIADNVVNIQDDVIPKIDDVQPKCVEIENLVMEKLPETSPPEIVEKAIVEIVKITENVEQDIPAPPSELLEEPVIETETISKNDEIEMPAPPPELVEEPVIEKELDMNESDLPLPPAEVVEEPIIEKDEIANIAEMEMPAPPADISVVPEVSAEVLNSVENLPIPPPMCNEAGDVILENNSSTEKVSETVLETKDTVVNSNHISGVEETKEFHNDNEELEQNLKNKSKDSLGNLIETIECNGNIEEEKVIPEQESAEIIVENTDKETPQTIPVDTKKTASVETSSTVTSSAEPGPQSPSEPSRCDSDASPDPATPQEPLTVSGKLADLIPEVPEVPELKTETLQETTSDVAVAN